MPRDRLQTVLRHQKPDRAPAKWGAWPEVNRRFGTTGRPAPAGRLGFVHEL